MTNKKAKTTKFAMSRRRVIQRLVIVGLGVALLPFLPGRGHAVSADEIGAFLVSLKDRAVEQLTDESLPLSERKERFRVIFRNHFDIPAIGRFVLGRYWRKADAQARKDFLSIFEEIMVQRFAPKFAGYAETRFEVGKARPLREKGQFVVGTKIVPKNGESLQIDWRIREKGGSFKILDVVGQGVSMVLTLRSEYSTVIKDSGGRIEGLVEQLRRRAESDPDTQTTSNTVN